MAQERDAAQREALAEAERARLARVVHDGVLQVLALVQRRGAELGGDAAELGRLAGEQEAALRTLIRSQDSVRSDVVDGTLDLAAELAALGRARASRSPRPAAPVELARDRRDGAGGRGRGLPRQRARARRRRTRPAWVLLEALGDRVEVSRARRGAGHPGGPARGGRATRAGSVSASRSAAGSPTSAAPPTLTTGDARHRLGAPGPRGDAMTIHSGHPFADPEPDEVRRFRGRARRRRDPLDHRRRRRSRAGLTISSLMVANGEPRRCWPWSTPTPTFRDALAQTGARRGAGAVLAGPRPGRDVRGHRTRARRRVPPRRVGADGVRPAAERRDDAGPTSYRSTSGTSGGRCCSPAGSRRPTCSTRTGPALGHRRGRFFALGLGP